MWVFAYGSLMWDGSADTDEQRPATLDGYHRAYCLRDERERGTKAHPSLTLGLLPGGACDGVALHLPEARLRDAFWTVWQHEMPAGFYITRWVPVRTPQGEVTALTFIADATDPLFAGTLPEAEIAGIIANTKGEGGSAREYLRNTIRQLETLGTPDPYLHALAP